jgi:hypothetical protein
MSSSAPAFLTDAGHVLLTGITGSGDKYGGKSTTAAWWSDMLVDRGHYDYAIAFDPKNAGYVGRTVRSVEAAAAAVEDGDRRIHFVAGDHMLDPDGDALAEKHREVAAFVRGLARRGDVVAVHDDAVMYRDARSLAWFTAVGGNPGRGRNRVKSLVVSQDPWDLPRRSVRSNLDVLVWVGPVGRNTEKYFRTMDMAGALDTVEARHAGEAYVWSAIDGEDVYTFDPVPEAYADL